MIGGMEYTLTILQEQNAGEQKEVENIPEIQLMIVDKMVQEDDQPLSGSLINVSVALPDGNRLLKDKNYTDLLNRGKGVIKQDKQGRKRWKQNRGKENLE